MRYARRDAKNREEGESRREQHVQPRSDRARDADHHQHKRSPAKNDDRTRKRAREHQGKEEKPPVEKRTETNKPTKDEKSKCASSRDSFHHTSASSGKRSRSDSMKNILPSESMKVESADVEADEGFANAGFATANNSFENSGFANQGFSSTSHSSTRTSAGNETGWTKGFSSKPRVLPPKGMPQNDQQQQPKPNTFNIIVNELSEVSIKREEHPMKGLNKQRSRTNTFRSIGPPKAQFFAQRGGAAGGRRGIGTFGSNAHSRGIGMRDGMNARAQAGSVLHHNSGFDGDFGGQRRNAFSKSSINLPPPHRLHSSHAGGDHRMERAASESPPPAADKSVQSSVVVVNSSNLLSAPRSRNYFLHDSRVDMPAPPTAADESSHRRRRELYDPRVDSGSVHARGGVGYRGGGFRARHAIRPPLGWRNQQLPNRGVVDQPNLLARNGTATTFGARGGGIPGWRSRADEDRVWSHDKFFEEEQAEQKLELVEEVVEDASAGGTVRSGPTGIEECASRPESEARLAVSGYGHPHHPDLWCQELPSASFGFRATDDGEVVGNKKPRLDEMDPIGFVDEADELVYD